MNRTREGGSLTLARTAALAAVVATVGDLLMLYVANAARPELELPQVGRAWLWVGGVAGLAAIPLYVLGYRSAARLVADASPAAARAVVAAGTVGALIGTVIHGRTAFLIRDQLDAGVPPLDPLAGIAAAGPLLPALWGVAALAIIVASVAFARVVARGAAVVPRAMAAANPALLTVVFALAGAPSVYLASFLTPAAPNLAHVAFFVVCCRAHRLPS